MINKRLCLVADSSIVEEIKDVKIDSIYRPVSKLMRMIRFLHFKSKFSYGKKMWLGRWRKDIEEYDQIIIFDSIFDYYPLDYIRHHNKCCKIHFCYRNRINSTIGRNNFKRNPNLIQTQYSARVYSYSKDDCKKYNLQYYSQFHVIPTRLLNITSPVIRDVYFIGLDKGRYPILKQLAGQFSKLGLDFKIGIVPDRNSSEELMNSPYKSNTIPYEEIIYECSRSKCILDITTESNKGITYRVLESIVLKKKLITNNHTIANSDFYDSNNMFIIGSDNIDALVPFIRGPYVENQQSESCQSFSDFCKIIFNI